MMSHLTAETKAITTINKMKNYILSGTKSLFRGSRDKYEQKQGANESQAQSTAG